MKKTTFFTALLFFAITLTSSAQAFDPYAKYLYSVKLGLTGGINTMFLNKKSPLYQVDSPVIGYNVGASFEKRFSERVSLVLNVNYQKTSYNSEIVNYFRYLTTGNSAAYPNLKNEIVFEYLNIPLLLRFYINYDKQLFIDAGGYYNHLITAKEFNKQTAIRGPFSDDSNQIYYSEDAGFVLGLGYNFEVDDTNNFAIVLRDNYGLLNIVQTGYLDTPTYANVVSLQLNYTVNSNKSRVKKK